MTSQWKKHCPKCQSIINETAVVCPECQRHLGSWGFIVNFLQVAGPLIAVIAVAISYFQFRDAQYERVEAQEALKLAQEAHKAMDEIKIGILRNRTRTIVNEQSGWLIELDEFVFDDDCDDDITVCDEDLAYFGSIVKLLADLEYESVQIAAQLTDLGPIDLPTRNAATTSLWCKHFENVAGDSALYPDGTARQISETYESCGQVKDFYEMLGIPI